MKHGFPSVNEQMDRILTGVLEVLPEGDLERRIALSLKEGRALRVKQGFDPTRPDLHLGHAVSLTKLRDFQEMGHEVIFIVGDYTARIGDPTGRNELRPALSEAEVRENATTYREQVLRVLDKGKTRIEYNGRWLQPLSSVDMLRLTAQITLARMLEREDFKVRFEQQSPLSLVEFLYPLLQAYDSVEIRADVELGGSDQRFNLLMARDIQERYGQEPQICVLMPLLRGTDGERKMSKSYDNYVGIAQAPEEQFGRTMSIPDTLLPEWIELGTDWNRERVAEMLKKVGEEPYATKRALARRVVERFHGAEAASKAEQHFDRVFKAKEIPLEVPVVEVSLRDVDLQIEEGRVALGRVLVKVGLAPSNSQAMSLVEQGAVRVDGEVLRERTASIVANGEVLLQKGKRSFVRIRFMDQ